MPEYDDQPIDIPAYPPRRLGPPQLADQLEASKAGLAEVEHGHRQAAWTAVETFRQLRGAGVDPSIAHERALAAARQHISPRRLEPDITPLDIAVTRAGDQNVLGRVAALDHTAWALAGSELDTAEDALDSFRLRDLNYPHRGLGPQAAADRTYEDVSKNLFWTLDETRDFYARETELLVPVQPMTGPLADLGYSAYDRRRTSQPGEPARHARAAEADMVRLYNGHVDAAGAALRAFREKLAKGLPAAEAKDQALAETAEQIAQHNAPTTDSTPPSHAPAATSAADSAALEVLEAAETTIAWLTGGELETASDAIDHYHAAKLATAGMDPVDVPEDADLADTAREQAAERLTGWYSDAAGWHAAQAAEAEYEAELKPSTAQTEAPDVSTTRSEESPDRDATPDAADIAATDLAAADRAEAERAAAELAADERAEAAAWIADWFADAADHAAARAEHEAAQRATADQADTPYVGATRGTEPAAGEPPYQVSATDEVADAVETARSAVDHAERSQQVATDMEQTTVRAAEQAREAAAPEPTLEAGLERG